MKKNLFLIVMILSLCFASCVKTYDASQSNPENVSQIKAPLDFDWKMTQNIKCLIVVDQPTQIFISDSLNSEPFATIVVGGDADPVTLSVPQSVDRLYVKYEKENGEMRVIEAPIQNGAISCRVTDGKLYQELQTRSALTKAAASSVIYIPSLAQGWGTLLFEDLWPNTGDYDFNDLVLNYKIQLYLERNNRIRSMAIALRVNAVGGSAVNNVFLRVKNLSKSNISEIREFGQPTGGVVSANMRQVNRASSTEAIFAFDGIRENSRKPAGSIYLNTEKGYEIPSADIVQISYMVNFTTPVKVSDMTADKLDFFIASGTDDELLREIHLREYDPINRKSYSESLGIAESSIKFPYYNSKTNLVWALNVPSMIGHTYEKVDFLAAYPRFATWAQSGGSREQTWYKYGISSKLIK